MTHPAGHFSTRTVSVGGLDKRQLLAQLAEAGVELNEAARTLFTSDRFMTSGPRQSVAIVELTVGQLGFPAGATMGELHARAVTVGLHLAPLELGPHLRLQYLDQPEGHWGFPATEHRAPPGSVTVASAPLSGDHGFPKGFYLRRIKGVLWLRGYWCDDTNAWETDDRLVFCRA